LQFEQLSDDYVEKLAAYDEAVVHHFFSYFGALLLIKLRARMLTHFEIDEIRQETFFRVLAAVRKNSIRDGRRLGAYVNTTCNHVVAEYFRKGARFKGFTTELHENLREMFDAEQELLTRESRDYVHEILGGLPDRDRLILTAVFIDERDKDTVCQEMGVDRNYLRVLVHRAKISFRQKFETAS
jgi:RNA polymerase sigma-70 factor (ECF subfamily)